MAEAAGAVDPESLARGLTLLLDGGLAAGVLDADPGASEAAKQAARVLVDTGCAGDNNSGRRAGYDLTAR